MPAATTSLTIGITTARAPECKRGVAVNVAASIARAYEGEGGVCVVDADPLARDVTTRLPVRGVFLEDFADQIPPAVDRIGTLDNPPLAVLGCAAEGLGRVRFAADRAFPALRRAFDVVVCDLVGGPTGPGRVVGARLDVLDWLLLAVTPEPGAVAASQHFLEHFNTARQREVIEPDLQVGVLCTGDESSAELSFAEVGAALDAPVVGTVPQLWGRAEPNLGFGAALAIPELDDAVCDMLVMLGGRAVGRVSA
ncbi:MAG: hypothetical protein ACT4OX_07815 [Actinomycetota bacterium]